MKKNVQSIRVFITAVNPKPFVYFVLGLMKLHINTGKKIYMYIYIYVKLATTIQLSTHSRGLPEKKHFTFQESTVNQSQAQTI